MLRSPRPWTDRQRAALAQASFVGLPVRHFVATLRDPVATLGIVLVRHGQAGRSERGSPSIQYHPPGQLQHPCTKSIIETARKRWSAPAILLTGDTALSILKRAQEAEVRLIHKLVQSRALLQAVTELLEADKGRK